MVLELLKETADGLSEVKELFATGEWLNEYRGLISEAVKTSEASPQELKKVSTLVTPQKVMAIVSIPDQVLDPEALARETLLGFEAIRDPGNLGTIVRTADWFGIRHILCSPDSVDLYNPKVVQSTMGAITRVKVFYTDLQSLLEEPSFREKPVYGTFINGENIYQSSMEANPLFLFGNESKGLSAQYDSHIKTRLSIPSFASQQGSESLNLASSVAVICSEIRRRD